MEKIEWKNGLMTKKEVLKLFDISYNTLVNWRKNRNFPKALKIRVDGKSVYSRNEIENWVKDNIRGA